MSSGGYLSEYTHNNSSLFGMEKQDCHNIRTKFNIDPYGNFIRSFCLKPLCLLTEYLHKDHWIVVYKSTVFYADKKRRWPP